MDNRNNQDNQVQVQIRQQPIVKRIETHSKHQKLVVRDLKTGKYTSKR